MVRGSEKPPINSSGSLKVATHATSTSTNANRSPKQLVSNGYSTSAKRPPSAEHPRRSTANIDDPQGRESKKVRASYSGQLATPNDFMASIRGRSTPEAHQAPATSAPLANNTSETNLLNKSEINKANTTSEISKNTAAALKDAAHGIDLIGLDNGYEMTEQSDSAFEPPLANARIIEASLESPTVQDASHKMENDPYLTSILEAGMLNPDQFKTLLTYMTYKGKNSSPV